jgi:hypothetical protein
MPLKTQTDDQIPPSRVAIALFLLSFGTVLFTVILFRLLTFFIMPSLFFDLLFIGFPLGALLGAYFFKIDFKSFEKSLWILQAVMVLSVFAMLLCKHFDYLRAHLFDVELMRLFLQMLIFTLFFLPFFIAYGLSEYIGYQIGRRVIQGKMYMVYALYLFGAALGYLFAEFTFSILGVIPVITIPFLCVTLAMTLLRTHMNFALGTVYILLAVLFIYPRMDNKFLDLYKGTSFQSTHYYSNQGYESIYQKWGKYSLIEIMKAPSEEPVYAGFYSDIHQWVYAPDAGFLQHGLGMLPLDYLPEGSSIAVVGSGGGRQVQYAKIKGEKFERILAIEIEPGVLRAVREDLSEIFNQVYEGDNIEVENREARSYMEESDEQFDLIYLPSVGGYPQMMLEPGNMIRTIDAFKTLSKRLTDEGMLAIWFPRGLDPQQILTEQYIRTFESPQINLKVNTFRSSADILILAAKSEDLLPTIEEARQFFLGSREKLVPYGPSGSVPLRVTKTWDDEVFKPITDNQPFLAGNMQHIFSVDQVGRLFMLVAGLLVVFGGSLLFFLGKKGESYIAGRTFNQTVWISVLVGANFLIMEHYLILALFKKMYVYHDALVLGAISFLVISGLGSTLITAKHRPVFQLAGCIFILILLFSHNYLNPMTNVLLLAPVAFVTGSFFPALFEAAAKKPLVVFAADAIGSAIGMMVSFFVPIVLGFNWFFVVGTVVFWTTVVGTYLFFKNLKIEGA